MEACVCKGRAGIQRLVMHQKEDKEKLVITESMQMINCGQTAFDSKSG
jgi:hypothetical protein